MQKLERVNGFLDLDKYYEEVKRIQGYSDFDLFLDEFIKESYYSFGHYWLNINGEYYYYKWTPDIYEELIVSECAKLLNIDAVEYDLAIFRETEGVISKSYRKYGYIYFSGMDILYDYLIDENNHESLKQMGCDLIHLQELHTNSDKAEYLNNLEVIWQALEYRYKKLKRNAPINELMEGLIKYFCLNILIGQYDAFPQNFEIGESKDNIYLAPYYDGSQSFGKQCYDPRQSMSVSYEDRNTNNYRVLEEFFKISSQDYINVFMEMYNTLTVDTFLNILKNIEEKIGKSLPEMTKKRIIERYIANREDIERVINKERVNGMR